MGRLDNDWGIVTQARGRVRARVRRLASERPSALLEALLQAQALHARTVAAARRWAWAWAWDELARDFSFDLERPLSAPCEQRDELDLQLPSEAIEALDTWVLLVVLKGRSTHLQRCVREGSTGDRDTTWGRLLSDDLPRGLAVERYQALRVELADSLGLRLATLRPLLTRIAEMEAGRTLRRRFEALLGDTWHPEMAFPRAGFPTFVRHAREAIR